MERFEAHELLDAARDGMPFSAADINDALVATGDLEPDLTPRVVHREVGTWERGAGRLLRPAAWLDSMVPA